MKDFFASCPIIIVVSSMLIIDIVYTVYRIYGTCVYDRGMTTRRRFSLTSHLAYSSLVIKPRNSFKRKRLLEDASSSTLESYHIEGVDVSCPHSFIFLPLSFHFLLFFYGQRKLGLFTIRLSFTRFFPRKLLIHDSARYTFISVEELF